MDADKLLTAKSGEKDMLVRPTNVVFKALCITQLHILQYRLFVTNSHP